jgi:O-antigen biosynthesis protein
VVDSVTPAHVLHDLQQFPGNKVRIVPFDRPFNYSEKINLGAIVSKGEHLLMLNDDIEVIVPDFIERMVMYSRLPGMGAVGAKLLYPDTRIQHAGVVFLERGPAHTYRGFPGDHLGHFANARVAANYTAVTGACVMSPRKAFEEVGGLSEKFPMNFNDIDYCLKLRAKGYRVMVDPDIQLFHFESSSRSPSVHDWEHYLLHDRWSWVFHPDPYYNPGFSPGSVDFVPPVYLGDGSVV